MRNFEMTFWCHSIFIAHSPQFRLHSENEIEQNASHGSTQPLNKKVSKEQKEKPHHTNTQPIPRSDDKTIQKSTKKSST